MSITATDVITTALIFLGALDPGEAPNSSELNDGLARLNDMLDTWSLERMNIFSVSSALYNLTNTISVYTIGTGQTINVARPLKIEAANVVMPSTGTGNLIRKPLELVNDVQWSHISQKSMAASMPSKMYYDYGFPTGNISLWPTPTFGSSSRQVELFVWNPLTQFADLTTAVTFPAGYARAIRTAMAIELATEYALQPSQTLIQQATESKAAIRMMNASMVSTPSGPPEGGALNAVPSAPPAR